MFRVWCDSYGHEVLIAGYQVRGVERRHDGDVTSFLCACGREASVQAGSGASVHHAVAERLPLAV
ncbi:MAG: hypothetical protein ACFCVC_04750 [Acidimicrobiia bacterium]